MEKPQKNYLKREKRGRKRNAGFKDTVTSVAHKITY